MKKIILLFEALFKYMCVYVRTMYNNYNCCNKFKWPRYSRVAFWDFSLPVWPSETSPPPPSLVFWDFSQAGLVGNLLFYQLMIMIKMSHHTVIPHTHTDTNYWLLLMIQKWAKVANFTCVYIKMATYLMIN